jgi:hypothetical protein
MLLKHIFKGKLFHFFLDIGFLFLGMLLLDSDPLKRQLVKLNKTHGKSEAVQAILTMSSC